MAGKAFEYLVPINQYTNPIDRAFVGLPGRRQVAPGDILRQIEKAQKEKRTKELFPLVAAAKAARK